ncbi:site-specific integrase [Rhodospirillaceae bacterium SYSU D60014]|uniref:tyrosine-type recombinase/integrase n=1 Tax=Virgifigura deserti TaxID=2268457 RepID=UPI000E6732FA
MPRVKLTDAAVQRIKPPTREARQVDYWDQHLGSFGLRVSYNGTKAWVVQPRALSKGKWTPTRVTLGRYPALSLADARQKAKDALRLASEGKNPRDALKADKARLEDESRNTFDVLADDFLAKYVKRKGLEAKTLREYERTLKGADVAAWRDKPISSIGKRDVHDLLDTIVDRGSPIAANRTLAYLRRFFNWCVERDVISAAPTDRVKQPSKDNRRERVLSNAEIPEVWAAFEAETGLFGPLFKLLLLTGQRRDEVSGARWDEFRSLEGDNPVWEIPGERTKNDLRHIVPLVPQAVEILKAVTRVEDSPFVFTTTGETYVSGLSKPKERVDTFIAERRTKAGISEAIPHWTLHDLRRTVSTRMHEDLGIQPHIVEAVLNHISGHKAGVAGNYNRALYLTEKRRALEAWANHIDKLLGRLPQTNIVELRPAVGATSE